MTNKSNLIAQQNDDFRKAMGKPFLMGPRIPGKYVMSQGVSHMTPDKKIEILIKTREFDEFNEGNNPHGERDMGRFKLEDNKTDILWKIDYYDINYEFLSNDPSDLSKTRRVLKTMLSCEY